MELEAFFDAKYSLPRFGKIPPVERSKTVKALLFKISVITGWPLPEQDEVRKILYDQLEKKLSEDYADLNTDEIELATRTYGTTIKDWGKNINLSLLDEILIPYKSKRLELSHIEEKAECPIQLNVIEPIANDEELVETVKSVFLKTQLVGLIPVKVYDILTAKGEIELDFEDKTKIRAKVEARLFNEAQRDGLTAIRDLKLLKERHRDYEIKVRNECKKETVANYFTLQNNIDNF